MILMSSIGKVMDKEKTFFIVTFRDVENLEKSKNMTIKVRKVGDSSLGLGFVALSDFVFTKNRAIVDPQEERMRERFENTKALHISLYHIVSIEEVGEEHEGLTFLHDKSNLFFLSPNNSNNK